MLDEQVRLLSNYQQYTDIFLSIISGSAVFNACSVQLSKRVASIGV